MAQAHRVWTRTRTRTERKLTGPLLREREGRLSNITEGEGGSIPRSCLHSDGAQSQAQLGLPGIWTWPGTLIKPQLEPRVGWEFGVCPPRPLGPRKTSSGPRAEVQ